MPTEDAYSSGHLVLSHFRTCKCSNVETNISWTCLVSGLLSFEHPSVLLFLLNAKYEKHALYHPLKSRILTYYNSCIKLVFLDTRVYAHSGKRSCIFHKTPVLRTLLVEHNERNLKMSYSIYAFIRHKTYMQNALTKHIFYACCTFSCVIRCVNRHRESTEGCSKCCLLLFVVLRI